MCLCTYGDMIYGRLPPQTNEKTVDFKLEQTLF